MIEPKLVSTFYTMPSFEPRSMVAVSAFLEAGGSREAIHLARLSELRSNFFDLKDEIRTLGLPEITLLDRFSTRSLWNWVWSVTCAAEGNVVIDATCFTRELLGMIIFALSVRRNNLNTVEVQYVSTGPNGYASQNISLSEEERWLSRGVAEIRSILGYPGNFKSEQRRRVVAFAGHERDRLLEILEYIEPTVLSMSSEKEHSSTVDGARAVSKSVADELRDRIPLPVISEVAFSANSIQETQSSLETLIAEAGAENISVLAMNTKLSFIGASLCALEHRNVRLIYAVPEAYNPLYSSDSGDLKKFDITYQIKAAKTTPVQPNQGKSR